MDNISTLIQSVYDLAAEIHSKLKFDTQWNTDAAIFYILSEESADLKKKIPCFESSLY